MQWIISLMTATSVGGGGGTSPRPGIIGLMGVIPVIMLRPGSKPGTQIESGKHTDNVLTTESETFVFS